MVKHAYVIYRGNVQGVGFRYTARSLAQRFRISGYVKNLTNGAVEIVAEGNQAEVEEFLARVDQRMGNLVESSERKWLDATGEFVDFSIRF